VCVWAQRRGQPDEVVEVTEAMVTMVAVDDDLNPVPLSSAPAA
jgi:acyl-CoA hydrolase